MKAPRLAAGCAFMTRLNSLAGLLHSRFQRQVRARQQAKYPTPNSATTAISIAAQSLAMFSGPALWLNAVFHGSR